MFQEKKFGGSTTIGELQAAMKVFGGIQLAPMEEGAPKTDAELDKMYTVDAVCNAVKKKEIKRICVLTGAGISTNAGIPDFRSPGSGLYSQMEKYKLPYPEAVFSIDYFKTNPSAFYTIAKGMIGNYVPTKFHYFIRLLQDKGLLLKNFTQNIDDLEMLAGVKKELILQAHGSTGSSHCSGCGKEIDNKLMRSHLETGYPLFCADCKSPCKPDIVMFGEALPLSFSTQMNDVTQADLIIVAGTTLKVFPFSALLDLAAPNTPRIIMDIKEPEVITGKKDRRNITVLGNVEDTIIELVKKMGLFEEFKKVLVERDALKKKYDEEAKKK